MKSSELERAHLAMLYKLAERCIKEIQISDIPSDSLARQIFGNAAEEYRASPSCQKLGTFIRQQLRIEPQFAHWVISFYNRTQEFRGRKGVSKSIIKTERRGTNRAAYNPYAAQISRVMSNPAAYRNK